MPTSGTVTVGAVATSFVIGTGAAWYETVVLLGPVSASAIVIAAVLGVVYLSFAVAVVAFAASTVRSALATVGISLAVLFLLPIAATYEPVGRWAPSALSQAFGLLELGADDVGRYSGPVMTAVILIVVMLSAARFRLNNREL